MKNDKSYINVHNIPITLFEFINKTDLSDFNVTKPGLYYAIKVVEPLEYEIKQQFINEIRNSIDALINFEILPPTGLARGKLNTKLTIKLSRSEQDLIYDNGVNPIMYMNDIGKYVLWGQKFVTKEGTIERIFNKTSSNPGLNPKFVTLSYE